MAAAHAECKSTAWDFSQALELVNSLWTPPFVDYESPSSARALPSTSVDPIAAVAKPAVADTRMPLDNPVDRSHATKESSFQAFEHRSILGHLPGVFQYLGVASPSGPPSGEWTAEHFVSKIDYASDGAAYSSSQKLVGLGGKDVDDGNVATDRSESPPRTPASRRARRRRNQRIREGLEATATDSKRQQTLVSDSEVDMVMRNTPARTASVHFMRNGSTSTTPTFDHPSSLTQTDLSSSRYSLTSHHRATTDEHPKSLVSVPDQVVPHTPSGPRSTQDAAYTQPGDSVLSTIPVPRTAPASPNTSLRFLPASVKPLPMKTDTPNDSSGPSLSASRPSVARNWTTHVEPTILRSGADRHWALLLKILDAFPEDRGNLVAPMNLTTHNNDVNGIHVFVDASNIFIGFMEQLRRSRGMPLHTKLPSTEPSFDAFALLIERRRPVAKRIMVGSLPEVPAFQKARDVGYEVSTLDKVWKARELTERQIFFRDKDAGLIGRHTKPPPHGKRLENQGSSSGSETAAPQYAKASWVEQGVDEILHLKILESLVDRDAPSTIVLATGDAAQAEFSGGFKAMVDRALNKGWSVELYSWSKNINSLYKSPQFLTRWERQFKIVYLDAFAEELLDM